MSNCVPLLLQLLALLDHKFALLGRVARLDTEIAKAGHYDQHCPSAAYQSRCDDIQYRLFLSCVCI